MDETVLDNALVTKAKEDADAFALLYRRHLHRVYSYLISRVGNVHDAQDLTTQTFIAALNGIHTYQSRGPFITWLLGIARYKLSDHFRNRHETVSINEIVPLTDGMEAVEDIIINRLRIEEISMILAKLNPERAEALRLRYFADLKIREVAEMMEKSDGAVKMLISRGLEDIRQVLDIQEELS